MRTTPFSSWAWTVLRRRLLRTTSTFMCLPNIPSAACSSRGTSGTVAGRSDVEDRRGRNTDMALPVDKLGTHYEPRTATIEPERAKAYAAATNDDNPAYESGKYAPPVFGVVPAWDVMTAVAADVIPPEA